MVKTILATLALVVFGLLVLTPSQLALAQAQPQDGCGDTRYFLGIPSWDRGLTSCEDIGIDELVDSDKKANPIFIVMLNITEMITRLAGLVAIVFVIVGGFKYVLSEGNPQKVSEAQATVMNAVIGLVIAVLAIAVINIVLRMFGAI